MDTLVCFITIRAVVVYSFLFIILVTFSKFLLFKDNEEKSMQKIIGGMSVFVMAIISQNEWVYGVSLFIGGLIIASEKFMRSLAAIMKASGDKLPDTITALDKVDVSNATPKEIKKQQEEEIKDLPITQPKPFAVTFKEQIAKKRKIEDQVVDYFSGIYGKQFESQMKLENEYGSIVVDGVIKVQGKITTLLEVKYVDRLESIVPEYLIRRTLEKTRLLLLPTQIIIAFISENIDQKSADRFTEKMMKKYKNIRLMFFKSDGKDHIQKIPLSIVF